MLETVRVNSWCMIRCLKYPNTGSHLRPCISGKYLKFKIAVMNFQLSLFSLKILGKQRKEECNSLLKSCKHAHFFCVLPHGFPRKRETARSFKPRLCYVAFCFLPLTFICKQSKKQWAYERTISNSNKFILILVPVSLKSVCPDCTAAAARFL